MKKLVFALLAAALLAPWGVLKAETPTTRSWASLIKQAAREQKAGKLKASESALLNSILVVEPNGEGDLRLAYSLDYLGTLYLQEKDRARAQAVWKRALHSFTLARGKDHPETLAVAGRLAEVYDMEGLYAKSEPLYRRVLEAHEAAKAPDLTLSTDLDNLAVSLDAQKRYTRALPLYERALKLRRLSAGPDSPGVSEILNNLARLYYMKGDLKKSEALFRQAIAIDRKALGPRDPMVADDYLRLAPVLRHLGKDAEAERISGEARSIREAAKP